MKVTVELKNGEALGPYQHIYKVDLYNQGDYVTMYTKPVNPITESSSPGLFINVTDDVLLILMEEDENG